MTIPRRIAREPLVQFLLLGLLLFGVAQLIQVRRARPVIVVDAAQRDYQRSLYRAQFATEPDPARLRELTDTYVRDEALYREALRLGLDRDDEIIRRRLVQKMEFLVAESVAPPEPTAAQLADYHAQHAEAFRRPATVDFSQRYFADADGHSGRSRAQAALDATRAGHVIRGDVFAPGDDFQAMDTVQARQLFGESPLSTALFAVPPGAWAGPFKSGYGWHLVRVTARSAASVAPLAEVDTAVREAWQREARDAASAARIADLLRQYAVRIDAAPGGPAR
jgi:peptidyl-prolyl cis-trans isomerase C